MVDVVPCIGIMVVPRFQNGIIIDKCGIFISLLSISNHWILYQGFNPMLSLLESPVRIFRFASM